MNHDPQRPIPADLQDKAVLLMVSGLQPTAIREALAKQGLEDDQVDAAIAEARLRVLAAAITDRNQQRGTAILRLNDLYRRALAIQDTKTALATQREIHRLLSLYERDDQHTATRVAELERELQAARAHLVPLRIGRPEDPLHELCRLAAAKIRT